jgi:hypothetical protein
MTQAESALASVDGQFGDGRPTIHAQIVAAIDRRGGAQRSLDLTLPGAGEMRNGLRIVAGGLDALFGRPDTSRRITKARSLVWMMMTRWQRLLLSRLGSAHEIQQNFLAIVPSYAGLPRPC